MSVNLTLLADFNLLNQPHKRRTVEFFKLSIVLNHIEPVIDGLFAFLTCRQLRRKLLFALKFFSTLGFILIKQVNTNALGYAPHDLILISRLNQLFKLGKAFFKG